MKVTRRKKDKFIQLLREGQTVINACSQISITTMSMYRHRRAEPDFAKEWDDAIEEWEKTLLQRMEAEADRRSMEGDLRPIGFYRGKPFTAIRDYSDILLMFRMKKLDPAYRETPTVDVKQDIHLHGPPAARMSSEDAEALEDATPDMRRQLLHVVKSKAG